MSYIGAALLYSTTRARRARPPGLWSAPTSQIRVVLASGRLLNSGQFGPIEHTADVVLVTVDATRPAIVVAA